MRKRSSDLKAGMRVALTINEVRYWDIRRKRRKFCRREDTCGLVKLEKARDLMLLLDTAEETQVRKVELPRSSAQVKRDKKQKIEKKKAFAQKEGSGRRQN